MRKFPIYRQLDMMDCGATCVQMITKYYGRHYSIEYLRRECQTSRMGVSMYDISQACEKIGIRTLAVKVGIDKLVKHEPFPCILHWNQNHFVVLHKVTKKRSLTSKSKEIFHIADPGHGLREVEREDFQKMWVSDGNEGVALLTEPSENFYTYKSEEDKQVKKGFGFLLHYIKPYKKFVAQLFLGLLVGSGIALLFPFLTQSLVDKGINHGNISFIKMILMAQVVIFVGSTTVDLIRSWLMIHMNTRINIAIISDFLMKLMRLPIRYFDSKHVGDIKQRINDHHRIQTFLTGHALSTIFSFINVIVFSVALFLYSVKILTIFFVFSFLSILWILIFLKRRKQLDYIRFQRSSENENVLFELITGMQEVKLNNCEQGKRWNWERLQAKIFRLNIQSLAVGQYQQIGAAFFNQLKNIFISYIAAREVVNGNMTLGMMMGVTYIIGQLNSPLQLLIGFIQAAQDAKISLDRLSEIHNKEDEEKENQQPLSLLSIEKTGNIKYEEFIADTIELEEGDRQPSAIKLENVTFQYAGLKSPKVLKKINLVIPKGQVTAIVGTSGSGKTTLMKLLLNFYEPTAGSVSVDGIKMDRIVPRSWRQLCGIVMQDGYVFSDTIGKNICMSEEEPDWRRLLYAAKVANIDEFIDGLPLKYNTVIGNSGVGISAGQRQRILIARAIYKNPEYLFLDEATSALDSGTEKAIIGNLEQFYKGKTVVVIAHRLSTVKHAGQIVVLENGEVAEIGTHDELVAKRGKYFELVKNQLELAG